MISVADFLKVLAEKQGKSGPRANLEILIPRILPALITGIWLALIIFRPLLSLVAIVSLSSVHFFNHGVAFGILWLLVAAFVRYAQKSWNAQPGIHMARPLTLLQHTLYQSLCKFVNYSPPILYDCGYFCTVIPFFLYHSKKPEFFRFWFQSFDDQNLYIDWVMPPSGQITSVCMCLHGVNGDSDANYVKDFASRMSATGVAVGCMVNRGMGDSITTGHPSGWFSSARTCDIKKRASR